MKPHLSVVSPVYQAEACLNELYVRLICAAEQITPDFEIVLVEDGGLDRSWDILKNIAAKDGRVKVIKLSRNFGQHYAITAGVDHAQGDWVVVMDCDLQDPPESIAALHSKAAEGFDVVFARRINRKDSIKKTVPGNIFGWLMKLLTDVRFDRSVANFSISSQKAINAFREYRERDRVFAIIMHQIGFSLTYVDIQHSKRFAGQTSYTLKKLVLFALQNIVAASTKPLYLSIGFGAWIASVSLTYAIYLILRYLLIGTTVAGFTTLAVLISFFFGLLFVQLGVLGLYLGKTFYESRRRPLYHIASSVNTTDN